MVSKVEKASWIASTVILIGSALVLTKSNKCLKDAEKDLARESVNNMYRMHAYSSKNKKGE